MQNKNKVIITLVSAILCCGISFGITYAYLISNDNALNSFTVGENTVEVSEEYSSPEKLQPGVQFVKKPSVKNTGNLPCFVRARADFSDSRAEEFCEELDINTENWEYDDSDGYYYYKGILEVDKTTEPLFTTVKLKTEKDDGTPYTNDDMQDFDILVYTESVEQGTHSANEYKTIWSDYKNN